MLQILEREEIAADMVENAVQQNADAVCVQGIAEPFEALVIAETGVDLIVVDRIVAVLCAFEYGIEYDRVDAHFLEMGYLQRDTHNRQLLLQF